MRTLHQPNFNNSRKYSAQDNTERLEAEREDAILSQQFDAQMRERGKIVVKGLIEKYGFSPEGAKRTLGYIEMMKIEQARFATPEMEKAALAADKWYWS